jgi:hypothetical protein
MRKCMKKITIKDKRENNTLNGTPGRGENRR